MTENKQMKTNLQLNELEQKNTRLIEFLQKVIEEIKNSN